MTQQDASAVTNLLSRLENGDTKAFNELYWLVYTELKGLAAIQRARWQNDFTINTTALVHEAYEKLFKTPNKKWEDPRHFYSVAGKAMRQILFSYAESKAAIKRGGNVKKISIEEGLGIFEFTEDRTLEVIAMETAMKKLDKISPREAQIVECRFYLGLSVEETSNMLDISTATVKRGWAMAKAWMYDELK